MSRMKEKKRKAKAAAATNAMDLDSKPTQAPSNDNNDNDGWTMQAVPDSTTQNDPTPSAATEPASAAAAEEQTSRILHSKHAAGTPISKPRKHSKQAKHAQNERRRAARARAESVADQLTQKVDGSNGRARAVRDRRRDWAAVNASASAPPAHKFAAVPGETYEQAMERKRARKENKKRVVAEVRAARERGELEARAAREQGVLVGTVEGVREPDVSFAEASFVTAPEGDGDGDGDEAL